MNPAMEVSDLPLKNFYRYSLPAFAGRPGAVLQPAERMFCPAVAQFCSRTTHPEANSSRYLVTCMPGKLQAPEHAGQVTKPPGKCWDVHQTLSSLQAW